MRRSIVRCHGTQLKFCLLMISSVNPMKKHSWKPAEIMTQPNCCLPTSWRLALRGGRPRKLTHLLESMQEDSEPDSLMNKTEEVLWCTKRGLVIFWLWLDIPSIYLSPWDWVRTIRSHKQASSKCLSIYLSITMLSSNVLSCVVSRNFLVLERKSAHRIS
jgi:hypothetical protein